MRVSANSAIVGDSEYCRYGVVMKRALTILLLLSSLGGSLSISAEPNALLGTWSNTTRGDLIGITLKEEGLCKFFIERALGSRSARDCTYETFEDRYVVFLLNEQGLCDSNPDFEFLFEPEVPLITLWFGRTEFFLGKDP